MLRTGKELGKVTKLLNKIKANKEKIETAIKEAIVKKFQH